MRLVRVATDNANSKFDGIMQDDLTLQPEARIALQSLSLEQEEGTLDLRSENASRTFSYSIDGNNFQGNPTSIAPSYMLMPIKRNCFKAAVNRLIAHFSTLHSAVMLVSSAPRRAGSNS